MSAIIWASLSELEQYVGLSLLMAGVCYVNRLAYVPTAIGLTEYPSLSR